MLDLKTISSIVPYSDEWWENRLGKLTSSKMSVLCGERGIGKGGLTYITSKVGEVLTGKSSERNITNEAIMFGIENETPSIQNYQRTYNEPVVVVNKHIIYDDLFTGTPDFLVIKRDLGTVYDCETGETKSFLHRHLEMIECNTPADIKKANPELYWQVISQMLFANVTVGNATFYNPLFAGTKALQHRVVFRKIDMREEFKFLLARMEEARTIYNNLLNKWK